MTKNKKFIWIVSTVLMLLCCSLQTYATDEGIGFEVKPLFSSNQIDKNVGYYYIQTEPGEKQTFHMSVLNTRDEDITLEFIIENAISTSSGNINYSNDLTKIHESLINPITEIVKPEKSTLTIQPKEEITVSFEVIPPDTSYDGIKMGRVIVKEKDNKVKNQGIVQKYQYGVGIITSESGDLFNDGDRLELGVVKPTVMEGNKVVVGEIVNPEPKTIENLQVRSYVTKKGNSKKIKEKNIDNFSFAPNSIAKYEIPWGLTNFVTGEYTFHFEAKNEFETFDLKKDFKITGNQANRLNKEAAFKVMTPNFIKIILIIMNSALILIFILIVIRNKKWTRKLKHSEK